MTDETQRRLESQALRARTGLADALSRLELRRQHAMHTLKQTAFFASVAFAVLGAASLRHLRRSQPPRRHATRLVTLASVMFQLLESSALLLLAAGLGKLASSRSLPSRGRRASGPAPELPSPDPFVSTNQGVSRGAVVPSNESLSTTSNQRSRT